MYTVKQLSKLAGVSNRTLHYYDQIGLLKPEAYGENGYRFYGDPTLLRLQQILFFKELGLGLEEIRAGCLASAPQGAAGAGPAAGTPHCHRRQHHSAFERKTNHE